MTDFYGEDLASIHHEGFASHVDGVGPELLARLARQGHSQGLLVDLGCGSGTFARQALAAGFAVRGVDLSPAMIALARESAPEADFVCGSLFEVELPRCQVITMVGEGLNYCAAGEPDDARLDALFARMAAALVPGGVLAFDVIVADPDHSLDGTVARVGVDWAVISTLSEDRQAGLLSRVITAFREVDGSYRRSEELHLVRVFDAAELAARLERHGFAVEHAPRYGEQELLPRRRAFWATRAAD